MPVWLQNLLVLLIVAACAVFVLRQLVSSLRFRGKLGNCCAKGCSAAAPQSPTQPQPSSRVVFLPAELLGRRK